MRAQKAEFKWSTLDRNTIARLIWELRPMVVGIPIKTNKLHSLLSRHIKRKLPVKVTKIIDIDIEKDKVCIGGSYYSDFDRVRKPGIEITLNYRDPNEKICLSRGKFRRMSYMFADTLLHEIIHMRQYRRRKFKYIPDYESTAERRDQRVEQSYLGCHDEIDAHGFNIACELLDKCYTQKAAAKYLVKKHHRGVLKSISLRMYLKAFDYNHNHHIIKKLKKRTIMYLPKAELGRPYLTKDWINR